MATFGYVYIMTNKNKTTLYIGVTNNLVRRVYEHKQHLIKDSFSDRYNLEYCIYYEEFPHFDLAIKREKELKKWSREKKEKLINKNNPEWKELVNERGFIRKKEETPLFIRDEDSIGYEKEGVTRFARNDDSVGCDNDGTSPFDRNNGSIHCGNEGGLPFGWNDNSGGCNNEEIPSFGRNDNNVGCYSEEIPPFGRNDSASGGHIEVSGGEAAAYFCSSPLASPVIPSETKCSEESTANSSVIRNVTK